MKTIKVLAMSMALFTFSSVMAQNQLVQENNQQRPRMMRQFSQNNDKTADTLKVKQFAQGQRQGVQKQRQFAQGQRQGMQKQRMIAQRQRQGVQKQRMFAQQHRPGMQRQFAQVQRPGRMMQRNQGKMILSADRALRQTDMLDKTLNLTDKQAYKVLKINQEYAKKDSALFAARDISNKDEIRNLHLEKSKKISSVLNKYQKEKYKSFSRR